MPTEATLKPFMVDKFHLSVLPTQIVHCAYAIVVVTIIIQTEILKLVRPQLAQLQQLQKLQQARKHQLTSK